MKKIKRNIALIIASLFVLPLLTCEISLGEKLDVSGPNASFISPEVRANVPAQFLLTGRVSDYNEISKVLIKVSKEKIPLTRWWKYELEQWWISEDSGVTWVEFDSTVDVLDSSSNVVGTIGPASWDGTAKSGEWKLPIEMKGINGNAEVDGQYLFSIQAWDRAGFSDDKSFKTLTVIIDSDPPVVSVFNPVTYKASWNGSTFTGGEAADLIPLHTKSGDDWKSPEMIGKFVTRSFLMQWQIQEQFEISEIDLRFYAHNEQNVDNNPNTALPDSHIYQYIMPNPNPNGSVQVPALDGDAKDYGAQGILKTKLTAKTTIMIAYRCKDKTGNANSEKILGFFVYWPAADAPWIAYTAKMEPLSKHTGVNQAATVANIKKDAMMIYPGREIKANAFHYHGIKKIKYTLYQYSETGTLTPVPNLENKEEVNPPRDSGAYSTGFSWGFEPPKLSSIYVLRAYAYTYEFIPAPGKPSQAPEIEGPMYEAVFRVQDITFPNIGAVSPNASEPLFKHLNTAGTTFTISGTVDDATQISSLCLVWINPQSHQFKEMSQLEYFRDPKYGGWEQAKGLTAGANPTVESFAGQFDPAFPNKLWKLSLTGPTIDSQTGRRIYSFSRQISLSDLNIGMNAQSLASQVFLLRAENPDERTSIVTYAPQGDTVFPEITITNVQILDSSNNVISTHQPRVFSQIDKLQDNQRIRINGTWREDSTANLPVQTYLYPRMHFFIGNTQLTNPTTGASANTTYTTVTRTPATGNAGDGTFTVTTTVGSGTHPIQTSIMKDSLVVSATLQDFGGNPAEQGASWLIKSDELKFLRISSEASDKSYTNVSPNNTIDIFLEFSKPVMLKNPAGTLPMLNLNTGGVAIYKAGQNKENTRQYFTYTIAAGHNVPLLDVSSLQPADTTAPIWSNDSYIFSWVHTPSEGGNKEEVRITSVARTPPNGSTYTTAVLPTGAANAASLITGKSLEIDTLDPVPAGVEPFKGTQGWHSIRDISGSQVGDDIYINVKFNKTVKIGDGTNGTTVPFLRLATGNPTPANRQTDTTNVRLNNDTITFYYKVKANDVSSGTNGQLTIETFGGTITDIPGKAVAANAISGMSEAARTIPGVYIDTAAPAVPTLQIQNTGGTRIDSTVNGTTVNGTSNGQGAAPWTPGAAPANIYNMGTLYNDAIRLVITPSGTGTDAADRHYNKIEYSTNYGKDWKTYTYNTPINWGSDAVNGSYQLTARQTDKAGNVSPWSRPVVYNWDKGALVTGIDSISSNGTYTNNDVRKDTIPITVRFRKPVKFTSGTPAIYLNTDAGNERTTAIAAAQMKNEAGNVVNYATNVLLTELVFNYAVGTADNTNGNNLRVTNFVTSTVANARDAADVSVYQLIVLPTGANLDNNKAIKVQTGALTSQIPAFTTGTVEADNSYKTTLTVVFNNPVNRGSGVMTIIQTAGTTGSGFRLPTVLTEAQRNRYRTTIGSALFDQFYEKTTNGLLSSGANPVADTSAKYVLLYDNRPANVTPQGTTGLAGLAEQFRQAEKLSFNANAQAVDFSADRRTLIITLHGTNALQVPGGSYEITIPAGFVQDDLSYPSAAITRTGTNAVAAGGIAKPFVRVNKKQETISINASPSITGGPRIRAVQPFQTNVRLDCRTPGTTIRYNQTAADATNATTNVTAQNWTPNGGPTDNATAPGAPTAPAGSTAGTAYADATPLTIGADNSYQGFIWRISAVAFSGTTGSAATEDIAYKTVLTYRMDNMAVPGADSGQLSPLIGDSIWIRGGDSIGGSSVPGYPLTWEDDWNRLKSDKKRAGIRVMTHDTSGTNTASDNNIRSATWRWISWEINVDTYVDFIMGRWDGVANNASNISIVTQYGPKQWAYQRAGWTSFKTDYRLFPGKHRYCLTSGNEMSKGALNFSATWSVRSDYTAGDVTYP